MRSKGLDKVLESDGVISMVSNTDMIGGRMDGTTFGSEGRVGVEIFKIGQDGSQDQQAIGIVDELLNLIARDKSTVHAHIQRMVFPNDGFAEQGGRDRNFQAFDEPRQIILESETPDL